MSQSSQQPTHAHLPVDAVRVDRAAVSHTTNLPPFPSFSTDAIHGGQQYDRHTGAVMQPISLATTFVQHSPGVPYPAHYEYARTGNPTRDAFESCVAALEAGKHALAYASGLAATLNVLHLLRPGDEVVCIDDVYGGTRRLFTRACADLYSLTFHFVDLTRADELNNVLNARTRLIWIESPTNPALKVTDIRAVGDVARAFAALHKTQILVACDNTFLSPYFMRPLSLGCDIAMHSISKYINGHSDVIGGVLVVNDAALHERLRWLQNAAGAILSPFDSYMALRGCKTLAVRMRQHEANAMAVARFLETHIKVARVSYPGLASHPQHAIAKKQQTGFGGMVTFWIVGGLPQARTFLETLKVFALAESLGGVESLAEHPAIMTHASVPAEVRQQLGISDTMIRLSCGIEDTEDVVADVKRALDAVIAASEPQ